MITIRVAIISFGKMSFMPIASSNFKTNSNANFKILRKIAIGSGGIASGDGKIRERTKLGFRMLIGIVSKPVNKSGNFMNGKSMLGIDGIPGKLGGSGKDGGFGGKNFLMTGNKSPTSIPNLAANAGAVGGVSAGNANKNAGISGAFTLGKNDVGSKIGINVY